MNRFDDILKEVVKSKRVSVKIDEYKLSKEQMIEALPILIDMANEKDDGKKKYLTTFFVDEYGVVQRTNELSSKGIKTRYLNNIISQDIDYINFENVNDFHKDEQRKTLVGAFAKFIKKPETVEKGLYIYGDMGIGKTYILKTFAKIMAEKGKKVAYVNLSNLVLKVKETFGEENLSSSTLLKRLIEVEYLFIDDIGAEKVTSWFRDEFLFMLLNERLDKNRITFFSSNYSLDDLVRKEANTSNSKYRDTDNAKRLVSRVRGLSKEIYLKGTNKR